MINMINYVLLFLVDIEVLKLRNIQINYTHMGRLEKKNLAMKEF